jgi:hypothetical protein
MTRLVDRMGWWYVPASLVFWTLFWWLVPVIALVALVRRQRRLDHGPAARRERRVARLLRVFPPRWRARHGHDFAALLNDTIEDGRGGPAMTLDVVREGVVQRAVAFDRPVALGALLGMFGSIAAFPQGIVAMVMLAVGTSSRSWFLALYVPEPFGWAVAGTMLLAGATMLATLTALARRARDCAVVA